MNLLENICSELKIKNEKERQAVAYIINSTLRLSVANQCGNPKKVAALMAPLLKSYINEVVALSSNPKEYNKKVTYITKMLKRTMNKKPKDCKHNLNSSI